MLSAETIASWDFQALEDWAGDINVAEHDWFDFKQAYDTFDAENMRKAFASLANNHGGYLFFGVEDGTKRLVGCNQTGDFYRFISDKLHPDKIDPLPRWDLIHTISIPSTGKLIHIVKIERASRFQKPCLADGKIYIRVAGEARQLTRMGQLRDTFFEPEDILFEDITLLKDMMDQARSSDFSWLMLDGLTLTYLTRLRTHLIFTIRRLEEDGEDATHWKEALEKLRFGISLIGQINQMSTQSAATTTVGLAIEDNNDVAELIKQTANILEDFAIRVKQLLNRNVI